MLASRHGPWIAGIAVDAELHHEIGHDAEEPVVVEEAVLHEVVEAVGALAAPSAVHGDDERPGAGVEGGAEFGRRDVFQRRRDSSASPSRRRPSRRWSARRCSCRGRPAACRPWAVPLAGGFRRRLRCRFRRGFRRRRLREGRNDRRRESRGKGNDGQGTRVQHLWHDSCVVAFHATTAAAAESPAACRAVVLVRFSATNSPALPPLTMSRSPSPSMSLTSVCMPPPIRPP